MTSNLEQLKKENIQEILAWAECTTHSDIIQIERLAEEIFALGTLNGLTRAEELVPEEKPEVMSDEFQYGKEKGHNDCRSQILSKIKEEARKYGN